MVPKLEGYKTYWGRSVYLAAVKHLCHSESAHFCLWGDLDTHSTLGGGEHWRIVLSVEGLLFVIDCPFGILECAVLHPREATDEGEGRGVESVGTVNESLGPEESGADS